MNMSKIDQKVEAEIVNSLPGIHYVSKRDQNRIVTYRLPQDGYEYVPLSWVCLSDMADLIRTSIVALKKAKIDSIWAKEF